MMLPPIGFFESAGAPGMLSTEATTWFVITTATPNYIISPPELKQISWDRAERIKKKKKGGLPRLRVA
jgi:hypothetical protein